MTTETLDQIADQLTAKMWPTATPTLVQMNREFSRRLVDELAKQKPVAEVVEYFNDGGNWGKGETVKDAELLDHSVPVGTKLFAAPVISIQGEYHED